MAYDVLILGEINVDLILRGEQITPIFGREILVDDALLTVGSSSVILACGLARLGLRVGFVGVVGDDEFGHFMLRAMRQRGVDTTPVIVKATLKTGLTVSLSTARDRALLTYAGGIAALTPEQVDRRLLGEARHLHVSSFFLQAGLQRGLPRLFREAHARGLTTSLDTGWDPEERWDGALEATLTHTDLFFPNRDEAMAITGAATVPAALESLAARISTVAIKLGAEGGIARRGEERVRATPPPVRVVDTTGAGDSFNAGFLYGWLRGWPLRRTLRLACVCGSLTTRQVGGINGQPSLEEALRLIGA